MKCNLFVMNPTFIIEKTFVFQEYKLHRSKIIIVTINFIPGTSVIGASIDKRFTLK